MARKTERRIQTGSGRTGKAPGAQTQLLKETDLIRDGVIDEIYPMLRQVEMRKIFMIDGRRYEVSGMTQRELAENERALMQRLAMGAVDDPTLNEYFTEWIARKELTARKPVTPYRYRQSYQNHLQRRIGSRKIRELRRRDILQLQSELARTLGPGTVNYVLQLLKQILNDAMADEIVFRNPAVKIKRLTTDAPTCADTNHRALSIDEQNAFLEAAKASFYYEYFAFLLCTGLRQGEGSALTWGDLDFQIDMIHVRQTLTFDLEGHVITGAPKSAAGIRDIPMNDDIRRLLHSQREKLLDKWGPHAVTTESFVFPSSVGNVLHNATANNALRQIRRNMKIRGHGRGRKRLAPFTVHALRSTFATRFIEQGGTPQTLKTILGHSSLKMTMDLYAHVLPNTKQKEMDMLSILPAE